MSFILICIIAIAALGVVAALSSIGGKEEPIQRGEDCATCSSMQDGSCKIACLIERQRVGAPAGMEKKKRQQSNKQVDEDVSNE